MRNVRQQLTQDDPTGVAPQIVDAAIHAAHAKAAELGVEVERFTGMVMLDREPDKWGNSCVGGRYSEAQGPEDVPPLIVEDLMRHLRAALKAQGIDMSAPLFMPSAGPPQG